MYADLLRAAEAAKRLRKSKQTLALWRRRGLGPAWCRLGGACYYSAATLDAYVARHTVVPTSERSAASTILGGA